jgi:DNA-directed RNA polymerase subunit RPC12/RpoP
MKENYSRNVLLRCIVCGDTDLDYVENELYVKCNRCGKEYPGGYDELVELNQPYIEEQIQKMKTEIEKDAQKELDDSFKKIFKGSKIFKIK